MTAQLNNEMGRKATKELMRRHDIRPAHSLGQNFLVDLPILNQIVAQAELKNTDLVLEIGPGLGHLTHLMARLAGQVIAIEIDQHLIPVLQEVTANDVNTRILNADALDISLPLLLQDWIGPHKVVANLPFYITTPLIVKVLCEWPTAECLVLTIQNEACERVFAKPGQGSYGPLAILCQLYGDPVKIRVIPADNFLPRPGVDSCLLFISGKIERPPKSEWPALSRFLTAGFNNRRKKLSNVLTDPSAKNRSKEELAAIFERLGLSPNTRAEELTPEKWYQLYKEIVQSPIML